MHATLAEHLVSICGLEQRFYLKELCFVKTATIIRSDAKTANFH
jgi:hypothetical protein